MYTPSNSSTNGSPPEVKLSMPKKRKLVSQACDFCRKSKTKCVRANGHGCSQCNSAGLECKYEIQPKKRGPRKGRVEELENSLLSLRSAIARLMAQDDSAEQVLSNFLSYEMLVGIKAIPLSSDSGSPHPAGLGFTLGQSHLAYPQHLSHSHDGQGLLRSHHSDSSPEFSLLDVDTHGSEPGMGSLGLAMNFGDLNADAGLHMDSMNPHFLDNSSSYLQWGLERDLAYHELMTSMAIGIPAA